MYGGAAMIATEFANVQTEIDKAHEYAYLLNIIYDYLKQTEKEYLPNSHVALYKRARAAVYVES